MAEGESDLDFTFSDEDGEELDEEALIEADFEDPLSEDALRELTCADNLENVSFFDIKINAAEHSLHLIGERLPNLRELKLNGSNIPSMRDLGSSYPSLSVLWMSRCNLADLNGVTSLSKVQELYLSFNMIADLSPLMGLETLQILDLDSNLVADWESIEYLSSCSSLHTLTLESNPIQRSDMYRRRVVEMLSSLQCLDDQPVTAEDKMRAPLPSPTAHSKSNGSIHSSRNSTPSIPEEPEEHELIAESIRSSRPPIPALNPFSRKLSTRPQSARGFVRVSTPLSRPLSAMSFPGGPSTPRSSSSLGRPSTPSSHSAGLSDKTVPTEEAEEEDGSSSLTFGTEETFAGTPLRALRYKRKASNQALTKELDIRSLIKTFKADSESISAFMQREFRPPASRSLERPRTSAGHR
eukprot:GILK01010261.1.p1 GENE.GILK01010261.1~~GILK01010261.1.p1  ORF type:complete len:426 (+),score=67.37 GILK01010261.1:46-1278(+)